MGPFKEELDSEFDCTLESLVESIGYMCITKQDDVFSQPHAVLEKNQCEAQFIRKFGIGEEIRDWCDSEGDWVIFPYDKKVQTVAEKVIPNITAFMWPCRTVLYDRKVFGGQNYREAGKPWYEYGQIPADRFNTPLSIVFAEVASHNHFILDRGGKIFKQTAPIIKLRGDATETDHIALLGLLNSSVACFYMKQVSHQKQMTGGDGVRVTSRAKVPYQFAGTCPL